MLSGVLLFCGGADAVSRGGGGGRDGGGGGGGGIGPFEEVAGGGGGGGGGGGAGAGADGIFVRRDVVVIKRSKCHRCGRTFVCKFILPTCISVPIPSDLITTTYFAR
jgi:hypothetical protein